MVILEVFVIGVRNARRGDERDTVKIILVVFILFCEYAENSLVRAGLWGGNGKPDQLSIIFQL